MDLTPGTGIVSLTVEAYAMTRSEQLDAIVRQFELNAHPFYQDWKAGTLPVAMLAEYGAQYGRFIGTIALGWETLGENHYAEEEREHEVLWADFKSDIGSEDSRRLTTTDTLVTAASNLFGSSKSEALGALYAFEAQQPSTARAKLDGLNEHYTLSDKGKEYFRVHADDIAEVDCLKAHLDGLSEPEFMQAKTACAVVCTAMYGALDGIYYYSKPMSA
jgi:pyrroloquinoline-quinone synthase